MREKRDGWFFCWPNGCQSFWSWLWYSWEFPFGWDGPSVRLREAGWRLFGVEHIRIVRLTAEDDYL